MCLSLKLKHYRELYRGVQTIEEQREGAAR